MSRPKTPSLSLHAREILDSRGNPVIEVEATTRFGTTTGHAPSGASTGAKEALELRDGGSRYHGLGVQKNVDYINSRLSKQLHELPQDWRKTDERLIELDSRKPPIGGNTTTAVSIACAKARALAEGKPFYEWLARQTTAPASARPTDSPHQTSPSHPPATQPPFILPIPFFNIINGGKHAGNALAIQEYMLAPIGAKSFSHALQIGAETYHELKSILKTKYGASSTNVGDEGGFAPPENNIETPLELIMQAAEARGFGKLVGLGIDAAASSFHKDGTYSVSGHYLTPGQLTKRYAELRASFPLISIEDPFEEQAFNDFARLTSELGSTTQIVGDDLLCTNPTLVQQGINSRSCNALLLKVNQAGTLSKALDAVALARSAGWNVMASHRSGETDDAFLAELAVGLACGQLKSGAPARGERLAKYNQLLRIEERLAGKAAYAGRSFNPPARVLKTTSPSTQNSFQRTRRRKP